MDRFELIKNSVSYDNGYEDVFAYVEYIESEVKAVLVQLDELGKGGDKLQHCRDRLRELVS